MAKALVRLPVVREAMLVTEFAAALHADLGKQTTAAHVHTTAVELLGSFLLRQGLPIRPEEIRPEHIEAFLSDLSGRCSLRTVQNRFCSVKLYFRWLLLENVIAADPTLPVRPLPAYRLPHLPDGDALRQLLSECSGKGIEATRDRALIHLLLEELRFSELSHLRVEDTDVDARVLRLVDTHGMASYVRIGEEAGSALREYLSVLAQRRNIGDRARRQATQSLYVFPASNGRLSSAAMRRILARRFPVTD